MRRLSSPFASLQSLLSGMNCVFGSFGTEGQSRRERFLICLGAVFIARRHGINPGGHASLSCGANNLTPALTLAPAAIAAEALQDCRRRRMQLEGGIGALVGRLDGFGLSDARRPIEWRRQPVPVASVFVGQLVERKQRIPFGRARSGRLLADAGRARGRKCAGAGGLIRTGNI